MSNGALRGLWVDQFEKFGEQKRQTYEHFDESDSWHSAIMMPRNP